MPKKSTSLSFKGDIIDWERDVKSTAIIDKVIWMYWHDDWKSAPYIVQKTYLSWKLHNPNWTVVRLTRHTISKYINTSIIKPTMTIQAKTDVYRLFLLAKYGGVWADASMLCMQPLDQWVHSSLKEKGYWMYDICSWFMIAARNSTFAEIWRDLAIDYWSTRQTPSGNIGGRDDYFWMDGVLYAALDKDPSLRKYLEFAKNVDCGGSCGPHLFFHRDCEYEVNQPLHEHVRQCMDNNPPYAMKMTIHGRCGDPPISYTTNATLTNGHYAIYTSLKNFSTDKTSFRLRQLRR